LLICKIYHSLFNFDIIINLSKMSLKSLTKSIKISLCLFVCNMAFGQTSRDLVNSGNQKYQSYDFNGAIKDYTEAIKIDSTNIEAYRFRGSVKAFKLKDKNGACQDWWNASELGDKDSKDFYNSFCN